MWARPSPLTAQRLRGEFRGANEKSPTVCLDHRGCEGAACRLLWPRPHSQKAGLQKQGWWCQHGPRTGPVAGEESGGGFLPSRGLSQKSQDSRSPVMMPSPSAGAQL